LPVRPLRNVGLSQLIILVLGKVMKCRMIPLQIIDCDLARNNHFPNIPGFYVTESLDKRILDLLHIVGYEAFGRTHGVLFI